MSGSGVRVEGTWRTPTTVYAKVDGEWKIVAQTYCKIDGVWRDTTFASPPNKPTMTYVSTGVFQISNYDPSLVYETTFVIGSGGTATLNTSNGRYTLSGQWSGFNVVARYIAGAPASAAGYMERKNYSYSCRTVPQQCCGGCNCRLEGGNCFCVPGPCPGDCPPNGQCGCVDPNPCTCGSIGQIVCDTCCSDCSYQVCDVLVSEPGYTNSGTEWYKVG